MRYIYIPAYEPVYYSVKATNRLPDNYQLSTINYQLSTIKCQLLLKLFPDLQWVFPHKSTFHDRWRLN